MVGEAGFESAQVTETTTFCTDSHTVDPMRDAPKCAESGGDRSNGVAPSEGVPTGQQGPPVSVEDALAVALAAAATAGQWSVVAQLARELEARRLAGSPNVVAPDFGARRGPKA